MAEPVRTRISSPGKVGAPHDGWATMDAIVALAIVAICASAVLGGAMTLGVRGRSLSIKAQTHIAEGNAWTDEIASSASR